jgi:hypothetical protein
MWQADEITTKTNEGKKMGTKVSNPADKVTTWKVALPEAATKVQPVTKPTPVYAKTFQWINQTAGDCHMSGVLTLYSNGQAHWDCTTWTDFTHTQDVWHETLRVKNAQGQELFGFGVWDSPKMDSPPNGGQYHWTEDGAFPPEFWAPAVQAISEAEC